MPEVSGTVKAISKSGKGIILAEYDDQWFNQGKGFEGTWPRNKDEKVTLTFESSVSDGVEKFWVLEAWPTSQGRRTPPTGETPRPGPVPTPPAKPDSYDGYQAAATGPVPTPPTRDQSILFQVCLKAAQDFVLNSAAMAKTPGDVLSVADLYYAEGLRLIAGEGLSPEVQEIDGDPGPEEPA